MNPEMQVIPYVIVGMNHNLSLNTSQPVPYIPYTQKKIQQQNRLHFDIVKMFLFVAIWKSEGFSS